MMTFAIFGILAVLTLGWFALPFLPAFFELRRKDATVALTIPAEHNGDVRHFARRFRQYVDAESQLPNLGTTAELPTASGTPLRVFVAASPLVVDEPWVSPGDIYATRSVRARDRFVVRGLLAEEDIVLAARSEVTRWVHSIGNLEIGASCILHGRASADGKLRVGCDTTFEWLYAPCIEFGSLEDVSNAVDSNESSAIRVPLRRSRRYVRGNFELRPDAVLHDDLVVTGALRVAAGARIGASLKSHGPMQIENDAWIFGSVISEAEITLAEGCLVSGIIVAEETVRIASWTRIGTPKTPSSVNAPEIRIAEGCVVHGTVWARRAGRVSPSVPAIIGVT